MSETPVAFARVCLCGVETAIAFAGEKWVFLVHFPGAEVTPVSPVLCWGRAVVLLVSTSPRCRASVKSWGCAQVVDGLFMRLLSRPFGVVRIRWGIYRRGWCVCGIGGVAAVPVGGGSARWRWLRCRWVAAGPGSTSRPTGGWHEACWVGGCGAGGRRQGQVVRAARLEGGARPVGWVAAVPVGGGRARAGLEIDHSEPLGSRVAISRAGRRPPAHRAAIDNKMCARAARRSGGGTSREVSAPRPRR